MSLVVDLIEGMAKYPPKVVGGAVEGLEEILIDSPYHGIKAFVNDLETVLKGVSKAVIETGAGGIAKELWEIVRTFGSGFKELVKGVRKGVWDTLAKGTFKELFTGWTLVPITWPKKILGVGRNFIKGSFDVLGGIGKWLMKTGVDTPISLVKNGVIGVTSRVLEATRDSVTSVIEGQKIFMTEGIMPMVEKLQSGFRSIIDGLIPSLDVSSSMSSSSNNVIDMPKSSRKNNKSSSEGNKDNVIDMPSRESGQEEALQKKIA